MSKKNKAVAAVANSNVVVDAANSSDSAVADMETQKALFKNMLAAIEAADAARKAVLDADSRRSEAVKAFYEASGKKLVRVDGVQCSIVQRGDNWFLRGRSEKRKEEIFVFEE